MEKIKKSVKESFVTIILLLAFAVVLFVNPENFVNIAINVFGYISIFWGVILVFYYLRKKDDETNFLSRGIILISFGIIGIVKTNLLANVFTIIIGGYLIILNANRFNIAINLKKLQNKSWTYILEFSILNILLSFLLKMSSNIYLALIIIIEQILYLIENIMILISKEKQDKK